MNIVELIDRLSLPHIDEELRGQALLQTFEEQIELLWKEHEEVWQGCAIALDLGRSQRLGVVCECL